MTFHGAGSVTRALARSLIVGLTVLWLLGVLGSGLTLKHLIDKSSDHELEESGAVLMSLVAYSDDLLFAKAILGRTMSPPEHATARERFAFQVRDASGRVLLQSHNAPPEFLQVPLQRGMVDVGGWRVVTMVDSERLRFLQVGDPLSERTEELVTSMLWLMIPLAALLGFVTYVVFRASRSLVQQVSQTADAVSRQDPQALGMVPLDGVVTEMRPAVEATNRLLSRLAEALESERTFTYNSAHELRTPIAGALAHAQMLAAMADTPPLKERAVILVQALTRLARLAERLLALARAEGGAPLATQWVDLDTVAQLVAHEFLRSAGTGGCPVVAEGVPARVRGDLDAVGLAVRNLVENALVHASGATAVRIVSREQAGRASIAVIDDGPGVPSEEIPSLLRRFSRGHAALGSGAGLGLAIVDTLARRMGARLVVRSPPATQPSGFEARLEWAPTT